jgi:hypothetical protein
VSGLQDVRNDPPSATDLAWIADRLTLDQLPYEQRQWFETLATEIYDAWPDEDEFDVGDEPDDQEFLASIVELLNERGAELSESGEAVFTIEEDIAPALDQLLEAQYEKGRDEGVKDATIPSRANTAQRKAMRLLVEQRVKVVKVRDDRTIIAECVGDSGEVYALGFDAARRQWRCTCPEVRGQCSHLLALKMIVRAPRADETDERGRTA